MSDVIKSFNRRSVVGIRVFALLCFISVMYFSLSLGVYCAILSGGSFDRSSRANVEKMIEGTAHRPFVYRRLVPELAKGIDNITPNRMKNKLIEKLRILDNYIGEGFSELFIGKNSQYAYQNATIVVMGAILITFSGLLWCRMLREIFGYPSYICWLIPPFGIVSLYPIMILHGPYVYDPMTLFSFTMATYGLCTRRRGVYYFSFLVALLNKETSLLLPILFLFSFINFYKSKWIILESAVQILVWFAWRTYLITIYAQNPGSNMEFHLLGYNLEFFAHFQIFKHLRFWGILMAAVVFTAYEWRQKPLCFRRLLIVSLLFLLPFHITFAWIDEFRGLLEIYTLIFLLSTYTLLDAIKNISPCEYKGDG